MQVKKLLATCQVNVDGDLMNTSGKAFITLHPPSSTHPIPTIASTGTVANGKRPPSRKYVLIFFMYYNFHLLIYCSEMDFDKPVLQDLDQGEYALTRQPSDEAVKGIYLILILSVE